MFSQITYKCRLFTQIPKVLRMVGKGKITLNVFRVFKTPTTKRF